MHRKMMLRHSSSGVFSERQGKSGVEVEGSSRRSGGALDAFTEATGTSESASAAMAK